MPWIGLDSFFFWSCGPGGGLLVSLGFPQRQCPRARRHLQCGVVNPLLYLNLPPFATNVTRTGYCPPRRLSMGLQPPGFSPFSAGSPRPRTASAKRILPASPAGRDKGLNSAGCAGSVSGGGCWGAMRCQRHCPHHAPTPFGPQRGIHRCPINLAVKRSSPSQRPGYNRHPCR